MSVSTSRVRRFPKRLDVPAGLEELRRMARNLPPDIGARWTDEEYQTVRTNGVLDWLPKPIYGKVHQHVMPLPNGLTVSPCDPNASDVEWRPWLLAKRKRARKPAEVSADGWTTVATYRGAAVPKAATFLESDADFAAQNDRVEVTAIEFAPAIDAASLARPVKYRSYAERRAAVKAIRGY